MARANRFQVRIGEFVRKEVTYLTTNQIAYNAHLENVRHNRVSENENIRHNRATEGETYRQHREDEAIRRNTLLETTRHNAETERLQGRQIDQSYTNTLIASEASKYAADRSAAGRIYAANLSASASRYVANTQANASMRNAALQAQTSANNAQLSAQTTLKSSQMSALGSLGSGLMGFMSNIGSSVIRTYGGKK